MLKNGGTNLVRTMLEQVASWTKEAGDASAAGAQARLLKAKLTGLLALIAAHHPDTAMEVFELTDLCALLKDAIKDLGERIKRLSEAKSKALMETTGASGRGNDLNPFSSIPLDERLVNDENTNSSDQALARSLEFDTVLRLKTALLEGLSCLTLHKYFKMELRNNESLMKSIFVDLLHREDLAVATTASGKTSGSAIGFFYVAGLFNLFRAEG